MYQYASKLIKVVDGDTIDLTVDLGCTVSIASRFRLDGIDAPEMRTPALEQGIVMLDSLGRDKYGRWVARLYYVSQATDETVDVSARMIADGFAAAYLP